MSFRFSSNDPAATFECRLDKGKYRHCSSPQLYLVKATAKYKKHTFSVRATQLRGNRRPDSGDAHLQGQAPGRFLTSFTTFVLDAGVPPVGAKVNLAFTFTLPLLLSERAPCPWP